METVRKVWLVVVGASGGAWVAKALFDWILGVEETWLAVAICGAAIVGGIAGMGEARRVEPFGPKDRRDTILGWGALVGGALALACLVLVPVLWGLLGSAALVGVTFLALRRV